MGFQIRVFPERAGLKRVLPGKRGARSRKERGRAPKSGGQVRRVPEGGGKKKIGRRGAHRKMERRIGAPIAAPRPRLPCRSYLHRRGRPLQADLRARGPQVALLYWRRRRCPKTSRRCCKCPCGSSPARTATRVTGAACPAYLHSTPARHARRTHTNRPPSFWDKNQKAPSGSFGEMGSLPPLFWGKPPSSFPWLACAIEPLEDAGRVDLLTAHFDSNSNSLLRSFQSCDMFAFACAAAIHIPPKLEYAPVGFP